MKRQDFDVGTLPHRLGKDRVAVGQLHHLDAWLGMFGRPARAVGRREFQCAISGGVVVVFCHRDALVVRAFCGCPQNSTRRCRKKTSKKAGSTASIRSGWNRMA